MTAGFSKENAGRCCFAIMRKKAIAGLSVPFDRMSCWSVRSGDADHRKLAVGASRRICFGGEPRDSHNVATCCHHGSSAHGRLSPFDPRKQQTSRAASIQSMDTINASIAAMTNAMDGRMQRACHRFRFTGVTFGAIRWLFVVPSFSRTSPPESGSRSEPCLLAKTRLKEQRVVCNYPR